VLIYCINKKTGYKVASFYSLDKGDPEFSFWNQKDTRVDSLDTDLTDDLRLVIYNESKAKGAKTNRFLLSDEERRKEEKNLKIGYSYKSSSGTIVELGENRAERIRNRIERVQEEETEMPMTEQQMEEERVEESLYENRENLDVPTQSSSSFNFGN
jgi:hypothetical protein